MGSLISNSLIPLLSRARGSLELITNSQRGGNVLAHRAACGGNICANLIAASGAAETREDIQSPEHWDTRQHLLHRFSRNEVSDNSLDFIISNKEKERTE